MNIKHFGDKISFSFNSILQKNILRFLHTNSLYFSLSICTLPEIIAANP